jgi:hypothetical protein
MAKHIEAEKEVFKEGRMGLTQGWELTYDSGAALEPFYYWLLDYTKNIGMDVVKLIDSYSFSYRSPEWQNQQTKMHYTLQDATGLMASIGQIIKSIVAVKKDYQRVKEALEYYGKGDKTPDDIVLKGIWMDNVDPRSGPASIAQATKNLQFFSTRDWFFRVSSEKEIDELPTNDRIKNYLKRKLKEYETWKKGWRESLEDMKKILEERIKSQESTVDIYKKWVAPMVRDIEGLSQKQQPFDPNLLKIGSSVYGEVKLVAYKENKDDFPEFIAAVELDMTMRGTSPSAITKTIVKIQPVVYKKEDFEKKLEEWQVDPVDRWIKNLMLEYKFTEEEKKEEKSKTFVEDIIKSIQENYGRKKEKKEGRRIQLFSMSKYNIKKAKEYSLNKGWSIYDTAKKSFFSLSWPVSFSYKVE